MKKYNLILIVSLMLLNVITIAVYSYQRDTARYERDILSDAIRNHVDYGDTTLMNDVEFYLNIIDKDTTNLQNWVYCY